MSKVLVINQHGSNRGDEAACRGMLYGLRRFIPDAEFTVLTVYPLCLDGVEDVQLLDNLSLRGLRGRRAIQSIARHLVGYYTGLGTDAHMADVFAAYRQADLIISAPGGPYIGDLYRWTETELLFQIMLGTLTSAPVMIYAPSMGPFRRKSSKSWCKRVLKRVDLISVRESISARHLMDLGIHLPKEYITIDSALQCPVDSELGEQVFVREDLDRSRKYIGFVPLELARFKGEGAKVQYIELLVQLMRLLVSKFDAHLVAFPQGYLMWHDRPFIESLVSIAGMQDRVHVLPEMYNSNEQQALVGEMDAFVSFRYHPGIFAWRQCVPCVNVAYEHKVRGFMQALDMEEFCLGLDTLTAPLLVEKLSQVWQERESIEKRVRPKIEELERLSLKNSYLASLLLEYHSQPHSISLDKFIDEQLKRAKWWA